MRIDRKLIKFALVGGAATGAHLAIFLFLRSVFSLEEQTSNGLAFLCAFFISWAGHYFWTFPSADNKKNTMIRFFLVALFGYGLNALWVWVFITTMGLDDIIAVAVMASATPLMTFILSKYWAFSAR